MSQVTVHCFSCQKQLQLMTPIGRREECPQCRSDVHVCKNCAHYDAKAYNECREPQADVTREKDRANFCDYFTPGQATGAKNSKDALLAQAEALFKKKS